jgi:predicted nucleotidyltransferase
MIAPRRIQQLISQFPLLLPTVKKLNDSQITWMIAGSGCLYLFGNERKPDDVDIF